MHADVVHYVSGASSRHTRSKLKVDLFSIYSSGVNIAMSHNVVCGEKNSGGHSSTETSATPDIPSQKTLSLAGLMLNGQ